MLLERDPILILHVIDEGPPARNKLRIIVATVHAFGKKYFQSSPTCLVLKNPYNINPLLNPALVGRLIVGRQKLAGVCNHITLPPVPPHTVNTGIRVINEGKTAFHNGFNARIGVWVDQQHVKVLGHPAAAVDGFQMKRRKPDGRLSSARPILQSRAATIELRGPNHAGNGSTQKFSTIHSSTTPRSCGDPFH